MSSATANPRATPPRPLKVPDWRHQGPESSTAAAADFAGLAHKMTVPLDPDQSWRRVYLLCAVPAAVPLADSARFYFLGRLIWRYDDLVLMQHPLSLTISGRSATPAPLGSFFPTFAESQIFSYSILDEVYYYFQPPATSAPNSLTVTDPASPDYSKGTTAIQGQHGFALSPWEINIEATAVDFVIDSIAAGSLSTTRFLGVWSDSP